MGKNIIAFTVFVIFIEFLFFANIRCVKPVQLSDDGSGSKNEEKSKVVTNNNESGFKLISVTPENNSVNFNSNKISFVFSKKININKPFIRLQSIDIYGRLSSFANISTSKNVLNVVFKEKLKKGSTYIITFLEGAVESVENEKLGLFSFVFSTGANVDSCKLSGSVVDIFNDKHLGGAYVFLYKLSDDEIKKNLSKRNILDSEPNYFTVCDKEGNYKFENISVGLYFLCAGEIDVKKFKSDQMKHKYGFSSKFLNFKNNSNIEKLDITVLKNNISEFKVTEKKVFDNKIVVSTNNDISKFDLRIIDSLEQDYFEYNDILARSSRINDNKSELVIDNSVLGLIEGDVLHCVLDLFNRFGDKFTMNLDVSFRNESSDTSSSKSSEKKVKIKTVDDSSTIDSVVNFLVDSNYDIISIDKSKVKIVLSDHKSSKYKVIDDFKVEKNDKNFYLVTNKTVNELLRSFNQSEIPTLLIGDVLCKVYFQNDSILFGDYSKNKEIKNSILFSRNYSSIPVEVNLKFKHFKVQLLDNKFNVVREVTDHKLGGKNIFVFDKIPFGDYVIRYMAWNSDSWSYGNILKNVEHDYINFYRNVNVSGSKSQKVIINS